MKLEEVVNQQILKTKTILSVFFASTADTNDALRMVNEQYGSSYYNEFRQVKLGKNDSPKNVWALAEFMSSKGFFVKIPLFQTVIPPFTQKIRVYAEISEVAISARLHHKHSGIFNNPEIEWGTPEAQAFNRLVHGTTTLIEHWSNRVKAAVVEANEIQNIMVLLQKIMYADSFSSNWIEETIRWIRVDGRSFYSKRESFCTNAGLLFYDNIIAKMDSGEEPRKLVCINLNKQELV